MTRLCNLFQRLTLKGFGIGASPSLPTIRFARLAFSSIHLAGVASVTTNVPRTFSPACHVTSLPPSYAMSLHMGKTQPSSAWVTFCVGRAITSTANPRSPENGLPTPSLPQRSYLPRRLSRAALLPPPHHLLLLGSLPSPLRTLARRR